MANGVKQGGVNSPIFFVYIHVYRSFIDRLRMSGFSCHIKGLYMGALSCNATQCNAMQCNAMQCNAMQLLMQCNAIANAMQCIC